MDTKKLKQKILDLAIRGKLVPQDPNDEPASVLLERIRQEKERLIKEKKIKRDKNESHIYRSGKSYYEKRGSEVRCIDDEIPFEIPENWEWCRLGSIVMTSGGKTPSTSNKSYWENGDILWVTSKDMKSTYISNSIKKLTPIGASDLKLLKSNTILIVVRSGILRRTLPVSILVAEATINQDLKSLTSYIDEGVPLYLYWSIIGNEEYILEKYAKDGTTVESLNFDKFLDFLIPIPPLSEQQRIVESIEQAFVLIDNIESDKSDLHKAIKQTKEKVLDLAIRGKLVPQDPNDEPASVLLERIKAEKQASAKGTKKQQQQPATTSDNSHYENMPFEIPESWCWVNGYTCFCPMESIKPSGKSFKYIDIDAIDNLNHKVKTPKIVSVNNAPSRASRKLHSGDVVFSMVRPYLGNIAYIDNKLADCIASTGFYVCTPCKELLLPMYCYYLMISTYVIDGLTQYMKGDNSPSITNDNVLNWAFPIPPLLEQKEIINKIETLISSINIIEKSLQ